MAADAKLAGEAVEVTVKATDIPVSDEQRDEAIQDLLPVNTDTLKAYIANITQAQQQKGGALTPDDLKKVATDTITKNGDLSAITPFTQAGTLFKNIYDTANTTSPAASQPAPAAAPTPVPPPAAAAPPAPDTPKKSDKPNGEKQHHAPAKTGPAKGNVGGWDETVNGSVDVNGHSYSFVSDPKTGTTYSKEGFSGNQSDLVRDTGNEQAGNIEEDLNEAEREWNDAQMRPAAAPATPQNQTRPSTPTANGAVAPTAPNGRYYGPIVPPPVVLEAPVALNQRPRPFVHISSPHHHR